MSTPTPPQPPAAEPPRAADPHPGDPAERQPSPQAGGPSSAPTAPAQRPHSGRKLSGFLKVSIVLLAALSVASISLLFLGDFEGKVERVFSTFVIFAVFVALTAFDTRREMRSEWYAPVALIANSYILGLLLIVTWMTPFHPYTLVFDIFWKSLLVLVVTRAVLACCQVLLRVGEGQPEALGRFAFITSVLAVLAGILFTAPIAIETFRITIPELYWKIAVATLILTALGLAITLLLRWFYSAADRETARQARERRAAQGLAGAAPLPFEQPAPPALPGSASSPQPAFPSSSLGSPSAPQSHVPELPQPLLPWPTFADGRPLPAAPDGRPDFSVLGRPGG